MKFAFAAARRYIAAPRRCLMKYISSWLLFLATITATDDAVAAVDQEYVPPTANGRAHVGNANAVDWAQTFKVGRDGT